MSSTNWISSLLKTRMNVKISVIDYAPYRKSFQLFILMENKSSSQISVSSIITRINGLNFQSMLEPEIIKELKIDGLISHTDKSATFPIYLNPYESLCFYVVFPCEEKVQLAPGITVIFRIQSNRGVKEQTAILPTESHYLHIN